MIGRADTDFERAAKFAANLAFLRRGTNYAVAGLAFVIFALHASAGTDAWAGWAKNFDHAMSACMTAQASACLSTAFKDRERPAPASSDVASDLARDLRTADILLQQKDARDQLWRLYGIDGSAYLGTGYSVPLTGMGARNYEFGTQREFFVPNLCAEAVDPVVCPGRHAGVWTWHMDAAGLTASLDKPIADVLAANAPVADPAGFATAGTLPANGNVPPLLIRFGSLAPAYYKGTFGRPGAERVFFADYGQVRGTTLRGAMIATGAAGLVDNPDPAKTFYVWIYAPESDPQTTVASWKSLFAILSH
jgi:hypothetical protein